MLWSCRLKVNLELKRALTWDRLEVYSAYLIMERMVPKTADTGRSTAAVLILIAVALMGRMLTTVAYASVISLS